jgi:hypothetical protein
MPSRVTIQRDCLKLYGEEKLHLKAFDEWSKDLPHY